MENFVSDYQELFNDTEKFLVNLPDKMRPILETVGVNGYNWLKK